MLVVRRRPLIVICSNNPLKALQHAFLGHCGRVAWPRGFHPLGRPDHRRPGSLLEIAELHGCPPKIKSAALLALRPGYTRPAGLLAGSYRHSADGVGVFDPVYLRNFIVLFMLTVVGSASTLALYLGEC